MDLTTIDGILEIFKGINPLFLVIGYFLFKPQIDAWMNKPKPVPTPTPAPTPTPTPSDPTPERPVIDAIVKQILPVLLPVLIKLIQDQVKVSKEEDKAA